MFEKLVWHKDRMLLGDLVFRLQHYANADWELGDRCFIFHKIRELVDQYEHLFASREVFRPQNIFEIGLWDGGSMAFWFELFRPTKLVGVDLQQRGDSKYFQQYVADGGLQGRVKTYWGTDQADAPKLRTIVSQEFDSPLDLVIDDASHIYGPTKSSFECLFPLLRPGGLYIIEDWAWDHWEGFTRPDNPLAKEEGLTRLVVELVEATGTSTILIKSLTTYQGFTVVERGDAALKGDGSFRLEQYIYRGPAPAGA